MHTSNHRDNENAQPTEQVSTIFESTTKYVEPLNKKPEPLVSITEGPVVEKSFLGRIFGGKP